MNYRVELHPIAQKELIESYDWYEDRLDGLGTRFINAVQDRFNIIANNPQAFSKKKGKYCEVVLLGFPFTIIYEVFEKQEVVFVSYVFHTKRNPGLKYKR